MKSYRDEVCDRLADIFCELDLFYANVSGRYDLPELSRVEGAKDALIKLINDLDRAGIFAPFGRRTNPAPETSKQRAISFMIYPPTSGRRAHRKVYMR